MVKCVGVRVYLLSIVGVLSGSNSSIGIGFRLRSFICNNEDDNYVRAECTSNGGSLHSRKKTIKARDLRMGFHLDRSHATSIQKPDHLKTQVELPDFIPCSRATQRPSILEEIICPRSPRCGFHQYSVIPSQNSAEFPVFTTEVNRRR